MSDQMYPPLGATARLSDEQPVPLYRYELTRRWARGPVATWIMLNPSTADATLDDATIRRCRRFTRDWCLGGFVVVNLYALRATDPYALRSARDPVGPENDDAIRDAVVRARAVICAWGDRGGDGKHTGRDRDVLDLLRELGRQPLCLGTTTSGQPRHPLRLAATTTLQPLLVEP